MDIFQISVTRLKFWLWLAVGLILSSAACTARLEPAQTVPSPTPDQSATWRYWPHPGKIQAIIADPQGQIWAVTLNGLTCYDLPTDRWQVWSVADGLADQRAFSLVWQGGAVWVGTQGGISRYDPQTQAWRTWAQELPGQANIHLYVDEYADVLWTGMLGGLAFYAPNLDRWVAAPLPAGITRVDALYTDPDFLWISVPPDAETRGGLYRRRKDDGVWQDTHAMPGAPPVDSFALTGHNRRIWAVGQSNGRPWEYNGDTDTWQALPGLAAKQGIGYRYPAYQQDGLWLWRDRSLIRYDPESRQATHIATLPQGIWAQGAVVLDRGIVWAATSAGLYAWDGRWAPRPATDTSLPIARVWACAGDCTPTCPPNAWIISDRSGRVSCFDPLDGSRQPLSDLSSRQLGHPTEIAVGEAGELAWFYGGSKAQVGWVVLPGDATEWQPVPSHLSPVGLLPCLADARLWLWQHDALLSLSLSDRQWRRHAIPNPTRVQAVTQDGHAIWLIKQGDTLAQFDLPSRSWQMYPIPQTGGWQRMAVTPDRVWVGGNAPSLWSLERTTGQWQPVALDIGCVGPVIEALAADADEVWVGGHDGVLRYDIIAQKQTCMRQNMLTDQVEQIILADGEVWFFHPQVGIWGFESGATP